MRHIYQIKELETNACREHGSLQKTLGNVRRDTSVDGMEDLWRVNQEYMMWKRRNV